MRAPVHIVHMELVGVGGHVVRLQPIVFKAFIAAIAGPDKNEHHTYNKKHIRHVGLFKGELEHF
jgi:hypothetical protein